MIWSGVIFQDSIKAIRAVLKAYWSKCRYHWCQLTLILSLIGYLWFFFFSFKILLPMIEFSEYNSLLFLWLFFIWPVVYLNFFCVKLFRVWYMFIYIFAIYQNTNFRKDKRSFSLSFSLDSSCCWEALEKLLSFYKREFLKTVAYTPNSCEDAEQRVCSWHGGWDIVEW